MRRLPRAVRATGTLLHRRGGAGQSAQLQRQPQKSHTAPAGAFAPAPVPSSSWKPVKYENADGLRVDDGRYTAFKSEVRAMLGEERVVDDPVRTFAFGTDASFYRLTPQAVVKVRTEQEVVDVLGPVRKHQTPVTFRAAGTSLSGQAITDSVLLKLSHNGTAWRNYKIEDEGRKITLEPALIGGEVNRLLAAYKKKHNCDTQYKIGPDPASIESCMIGGIVANNSSGMCCGVKQNTYHTLQDMRVVLVDGTVLDTSDAASRAAFEVSHATLLGKLSGLASRVQADASLLSLIREKYRIKNTTGYSINALADFAPENPIEILKRIMIGSEGTLGFVSQVTYQTVPDHPFKASAFLVFADIEEAADATNALRANTEVDAVEIFDRRSLKLAVDQAEMMELCPEVEKAALGAPADEEAAALLIECRGADEEALRLSIDSVVKALSDSQVCRSRPPLDLPSTSPGARHRAADGGAVGLLEGAARCDLMGVPRRQRRLRAHRRLARDRAQDRRRGEGPRRQGVRHDQGAAHQAARHARGDDRDAHREGDHRLQRGARAASPAQLAPRNASAHP